MMIGSASGESSTSSVEREFVSLDQGGPVRVCVRDGKIVRVRPLIFGSDDEKSKSWTIQVGDRKFTPPRRFNLAPFTLATRRRVYAENRVLRPLKRVDFDPNNSDRHTESRGKSEYIEISWDEALAIVAGEIQRIKRKYGPAAILAHISGHQMWGYLNYNFSAPTRFFSMIGYTQQFHNADSWEGWVWGAMNAWGFHWRLGTPDGYDLLEDALKNTELIVHWGNDPESQHGGYGGQESAPWRYWLKQLGKKQIFIDPWCNYTAVLFADKWITPRVGTDTALALAIAYTWLKEGTYDKEYVKTHTFGFDKWVDYVNGKEDKIPKTAEWASGISEVPARTIKALAREWGSKRTMLATGSGAGRSGVCRQAYAHEWTRMMVLLQAMQGLGKPGVNIWSTNTGAPCVEEFKFPGYAETGINAPGIAKKVQVNPVKQKVNRLIFPDAVLNPSGPVQWRGDGMNAGRDRQFVLYTYPLPSPDGSPIKMYHCYGGSNIGVMTNTNRRIQAYRSPNLEFMVSQTPWFEGESKFADIVLPACTNYEREDIAEVASSGGYVPHYYTVNNHRIIMHLQKCIEPLGESKSDYEIYAMIAERLGLREEYTEGNSVDDWLRKIYESSDMKRVLTWEEFKKKGYYVLPFPERHTLHRAMGTFYDTGRGLNTPSGKIEFYSQDLAKFDKDDKERPPVPHFIPSWEGHLSPEAKRYPLQLITAHPRYSFHTQQDWPKLPWIAEIGHRLLKDGYYWWLVRIGTVDAQARGIAQHDIVRVFNDRGSVLCAALVTERMRQGVILTYNSCSQYIPISTEKGIVDKGGVMSLLTSNRFMSKNASGFAPNSCLVDIEKWDGPTS